MDITFTDDWRQFEKGWSGNLPAPIARTAISNGAAEHTSKLKRRLGKHPREAGDLETATRSAPENAAERTEAPEPSQGICGAPKANGDRCHRQVTDGGRCWQHEEPGEGQ